MSKILTKEEILASDDLKIQEVEVSEWGGVVKVKGLDLETRDMILKASRIGVSDQLDSLKLEALTFIHGVVEPQFSAKDFDALKKKSQSAVRKVSRRIMDLSGIGVELKNV